MNAKYQIAPSKAVVGVDRPSTHCHSINIKIVSEYDQEIPQLQTADNPMVPRGRAVTRHQEDKLSKAINSLFPIKMIAVLEWT